MKRSHWSILFILVLIAVSYFYNYHEIVFKRPQSVHKWRQSDCASLALNYYQDGMRFFQPETNNLTSDGGTSGKACTSEIPILYYVVAVLYKIFGYKEAIFRILNTLLFFIGLFYLFKLFQILLKDEFWAISLTILFFTSPVLVFYGNNFLSNSSSLSFSIVGWYYFLRFYQEKNNKWFIVANLFFLLAASFKVSAFFSLFAVGGIFLLEILGLVRLNGKEKLFRFPVFQFSIMAGVFVIVSAWILYARHYNNIHDCYYFSTTIFPVWSMDRTQILGVFENIRKIWLAQYFHLSVLIFLGASFLFIAAFYKKNLRILNLAILFLLLEIAFYVIMQFWTFKDHDYYTIDMYIMVVILFASSFYVLKTKFKMVFASWITKSLFGIFVLFNVYYAHKIIDDRYSGWMNDFGQSSDSYTITPYLRELGIQPGDTIISIPDRSHVSLYLMNQKGWTEYADARFNRGGTILYNRDSLGIQKSINNGAKYLIVNGIGQLYDKTYLQSFCTFLKGRYNNTLVFDLLQDSVNFNLQNREIKQQFVCGAENLSEDKKNFIEQDSVIFSNGETQSADFAFKGEHSCKLYKDSPYGFTISISDLVFGESFQISVWRKKSDKGVIIASTQNYYNNNPEIVETRDGWERLLMEFFVTHELENKTIGIYVYNPNEEPVYFDDLKIVQYKNVFQ